MNTDRATLIARIERFAAESGLKPSVVCHYAIRNQRFHDNLLDGRNYWHGTAERLLNWLSSTDPKNVGASPASRQPAQKSRKSLKHTVSGAETNAPNSARRNRNRTDRSLRR
jgi:hypothetical protein